MVNLLKLDPGEYKGTYKVVGGQLCFDFSNTVSYRNKDTPHEWLNNFENLSVWSQIVGIMEESESNQLIRNLSKNPEEGERKLSMIRELREVVFRIFSSIVKRKSPAKTDINYLNNFAEKQINKEKIVYDNGLFNLEYKSNLTPFKKIIHKIYKSIIYVMTQIDLTRINKCKSCDWLFYDTSRNRSRQWCVMSDCGNRSKVNNFNKRQRKV